MSNTIILKNNKGIPSDGVLEVAELGFDTEHGLLFIGKDPDKGIPLNIIVSDIQPIGANSRDDILWLDTSEQVSSLPIEAGGTGFSANSLSELQNYLGITTGIPVYPLNKYDVDTCYDTGLYLIGGGPNTPSGSSYGVLLVLSYRKPSGNTIPDYGSQIFIPCGDDSLAPNGLFYRTAIKNTWNSWQEVSNRIIDPKDRGTEFPANPVAGQIFYKKA